jgi:hypothetical protein
MSACSCRFVSVRPFLKDFALTHLRRSWRMQKLPLLQCWSSMKESYFWELISPYLTAIERKIVLFDMEQKIEDY